MIVTPEILAWIARKPVNANMRSAVLGLARHPGPLARRLQLAMALGQCAHESGGWTFDHELWGNTPAQKGYEGRRDLGNTQPGDGYRFRGRSGLQITGRANYAQFTTWVRQNVTSIAPDFEDQPEAMLTDPWEGLTLPFFWETHGLEDAAETADVAKVTRIVNGGQNGLAERVAYTDRAMQILADAKDLKTWQGMAGLTADGAIGPVTRGALVLALRRLPPVTFHA